MTKLIQEVATLARKRGKISLYWAIRDGKFNEFQLIALKHKL